MNRVISKELTICNRRGLHARASAKFVKCVGQFDAEMTVSKGGITIAAKSIMGLMLLAAGAGAIITITARGSQANEAMDAVGRLIASKFGEDD